MMLIKPRSRYILLALAGLLLATACANQMQPAKQALEGADNAVNAASADASKYAPDKFASLQSRLADLKASFDKKDYAKVLTDAPGVSIDAGSLAQVAAAKKSEAMKALATAWTDMSSSVSKLMETVQTRVDALGKARRVPKGVDLPAAKSALADATALWQKAQSSNNAGDVQEAVNMGKDVKARIEAAADALKLQLPAVKTVAK